MPYTDYNGNAYDNKYDRDYANATGKRPDGSWTWEPRSWNDTSGAAKVRASGPGRVSHGGDAWEGVTGTLTGLLIFVGFSAGGVIAFRASFHIAVAMTGAVAGAMAGLAVGAIVHYTTRLIVKHTKVFLLSLLFIGILTGRCHQRMEQLEHQPSAQVPSEIVDWRS